MLFGKRTYRSWVGDRENWDLLAAHQFNVLTSLGLRGGHKLLDIGCGSLRGGRLFIMYLEPGNYYGIEPAQDVLRHAIDQELGQEVIDKRRPSFDPNQTANLGVFQERFDFILAHSVLVHAPKAWIKVCFREVKQTLKQGGKFVASLIFAEKDSGEAGWDYPQARFHTRETIATLAEQADLKLEVTDIRHPIKSPYTWIVLKH